MAALQRADDFLLGLDQAEIPTQHVLHAGMYARTIRVPANVVLTGALVKIPTLLIMRGHAHVLTAEGWQEVRGFNVLCGDAGRKQMFVTVTAVEMTMIFPTSAMTVEQAESEFTDECDKLMSRRSDTVVKGE